MSKTFQTTTRIINGILVAVLILMAFNNNKGNLDGTSAWIQIAGNIGPMIGIIALYILIQILLMQFAKFELQPPVEIQNSIENINDSEAVEKHEYTQKQIEIMEEYATIERQAMIDDGKGPETVGIVEKNKEIIEDTCAHKPAKNWKNYIPQNMNLYVRNVANRSSSHLK